MNQVCFMFKCTVYAKMSDMLHCRQITVKEVVIQGLHCDVTAPLEVREVNCRKGRGVFAL